MPQKYQAQNVIEFHSENVHFLFSNRTKTTVVEKSFRSGNEIEFAIDINKSRYTFLLGK